MKTLKDITAIDLYQCPIETQLDAMRVMIRDEQEGKIIRAVQNIGIEIDKEGLVQALNNDRRRYEAAWNAGYEACKQEYGEMLKNASELLDKMKKLIGMEETDDEGGDAEED